MGCIRVPNSLLARQVKVVYIHVWSMSLTFTYDNVFGQTGLWPQYDTLTTDKLMQRSATEHKREIYTSQSRM